jgi:hypothetical protein
VVTASTRLESVTVRVSFDELCPELAAQLMVKGTGKVLARQALGCVGYSSSGRDPSRIRGRGRRGRRRRNGHIDKRPL